MTWSFPSRGVFLTFLLLTAQSCGSSGAPEAKAPDSEASASEADTASDPETSEEPSDDPSESASQAESAAGPCADGSCFPCGSGVCPAGFYCDEGAQGGPGCSWLPSCAPKATCDCIERVLSDCSCSERDGAPHVKCG